MGINWKNRQPNSIRHAMDLCLEYSRVKHNRSIDHIADLMGLSNKWVLYKWLQTGKLPSILIRSFETACGIDYVSRYVCHSAHKLMLDIPTGRKATCRDIQSIQSGFATVTSKLLAVYDGGDEVEQALNEITVLMEELAWHRVNIERYLQPELDFPQ